VVDASAQHRGNTHRSTAILLTASTHSSPVTHLELIESEKTTLLRGFWILDFRF
jgi:hypothetical protein